MNKDEQKGFAHLIEKELNSEDKILKPDFNQKTGRELLAFYLQTKFKQVLAYDSNAKQPIFIDIKPNFIQKFTKRLVQHPSKRIMISITGESASGKSTICEEIKKVIEVFNMPVTILNTDNYFNDISDLIAKYGSFDSLRDNGYDVDSPNSFQLDILQNDLKTISEGGDIYCPQYLLNGTGVSVPHANKVCSNKIIVVEGMASMYVKNKDIFDVTVYVETDNDIRKERFLKRACTERNQDIENAKKHWEYITIAGEKYIKQYKPSSDIILSGNSDLKYFSQILEYIHTITNNFDD